jgi:hypothetical protein
MRILAATLLAASTLACGAALANDALPIRRTSMLDGRYNFLAQSSVAPVARPAARAAAPMQQQALSPAPRREVAPFAPGRQVFAPIDTDAVLRGSR